MNNLHINRIFATVLVSSLLFLGVSCIADDFVGFQPGAFEATGTQIEGTFEIDVPVTGSFMVVNYIGYGRATVQAGMRNGIWIPEQQVTLGSGTLRLPLTGTPSSNGSHSLFLEINVGGTVHTVVGYYDMGQNPIVLTFTREHPDDFQLGNARMFPFTIEPATANLTVPGTNPYVWVQVVVTDHINGRGHLTITPRTNFTGNATTAVQLRASYEGFLVTETYNLTAMPRRPQAGKRGVAMSTGVDRGNIWDNLYKLRPHWWWSWGLLSDAQLAQKPDGIEWVPSFWGAGFVSPANIARVNELYERGVIRYLRGFNEPDLTEESNISVEAALSLWRTVSDQIHPNIRLISPAESFPRRGDNTWTAQFMRGVEELGLRVDYIAMHQYAWGPHAHLLTESVEYLYARHGRRVWIMEAGVRSPNIPSMGHHLNPVTPVQIVTMMETLLPALENMHQVHRYSWFEPASWMAGIWPGRLIGCRNFDNGFSLTPHHPADCSNALGCYQLTAVGVFYSNFRPNTNITR